MEYWLVGEYLINEGMIVEEMEINIVIVDDDVVKLKLVGGLEKVFMIYCLCVIGQINMVIVFDEYYFL